MQEEERGGKRQGVNGELGFELREIKVLELFDGLLLVLLLEGKRVVMVKGCEGHDL